MRENSHFLQVLYIRSIYKFLPHLEVICAVAYRTAFWTSRKPTFRYFGRIDIMKTQKNRYDVRITNLDLLNSIERLYATKKFDSKNQMLNEILERGIGSLMAEYGRRKTFSEPITANSTETISILKEINERIKYQQLSMDDIFVMMSTLESLCSILVNVKTSELNNEPVNSTLIEAGYMSDLPEYLQDVKREVANRISKRTSKL